MGVKWDNIYSVVSFFLFWSFITLCWKQWEQWRFMSEGGGGQMTRRFEEERKAFSNRWLCIVNYALHQCRWYVIIIVLSKRRRRSPCVPAPGRCNTSLQHLWSPAHNSGSVCLEGGEPGPSPRLRCSSLSLRTPAAVNRCETESQRHDKECIWKLSFKDVSGRDPFTHFYCHQWTFFMTLKNAIKRQRILRTAFAFTSVSQAIGQISVKLSEKKTWMFICIWLSFEINLIQGGGHS